MRFIIAFLLLLLVGSGQLSMCQKPLSPTATLEKLFGRLSANREDNDRLRINDSIMTIIGSYVESDSVFTHKFKNLRYLGQITSPDSHIKIITWNLLLSSGKSTYFCYLIKKGWKGIKNKVYYLSTVYNPEPIMEDSIYTQENWYGALYYDIRPYKSQGKNCWILLGIDYGDPDVTRKIIDVLSFADDGSLVLGMAWFKADKKILFRDVFAYASDGLMSLRFSSSNKIIFDHLVPVNHLRKDDRQYYGSDFSFDAYVLEKDFWNFKINVDARNKN
jgi:hypothetical protein